MPYADLATVRRRLLAHRRVDERGCWLWTRSTNAYGYGQTSYLGRNVGVHRLAAHVWMGFVLDSPLCVLHRCDEPSCFNPDHLFVGTKADNTADMMSKGRGSYALPTKKSDAVRQRALALVADGISQREAARRVGVSHTSVHLWCRSRQM